MLIFFTEFDYLVLVACVRTSSSAYVVFEMNLSLPALVYILCCVSVCVLSQVNGKYIVKSGTDFRSFGKITLTFDESRKLAVDIEKIDIFSTIEEDSHIKDVVSKYMGNVSPFFIVIKLYIFQKLCCIFV